MIAKEERRIAAQLVRDFRDGKITNFQFERGFPVGKDDALGVVEEFIWHYYDDFDEHNLGGKHALTAEGREWFTRCALFLGSDLEYEWKKPGYRSREEAAKEANPDFWPFIREEDIIAAKQLADPAIDPATPPPDTFHEWSKPSLIKKLYKYIPWAIVLLSVGLILIDKIN